ncbi:MAG: hypothetical protein IPO33_03990 [Saprospiraceae bacterium]|nr:hypothetical protein [Candidatus Brachybacter algidus]
MTLSKKRIIGSGLSILTIDTSGNIIKEVKSEKINEGACYSLDTIGDGGYIYVSHDFPNLLGEGMAIRIKQDGEIKWRHKY